jgi:Zn-dependent protease
LDLQGLILFAPVLLLSVIAHEYAHGYAALKQGDDTALSQGRLTWNPVKHIDPIMTILLPAFLWVASGHKMLLGGAKPVPVDPRNYRNLKRGDIIVSLAGVATNLVIGLACVALIPLFGFIGRSIPALDVSAGILQAMMAIGVMLNFMLVAFNLIPIPPLDGSHVMKYLLPASISLRYQQFWRYGIILLIAIMWIDPRPLDYWLTPAFKSADFLLGAVDNTRLDSAKQWWK